MLAGYSKNHTADGDSAMPRVEWNSSDLICGVNSMSTLKSNSADRLKQSVAIGPEDTQLPATNDVVDESGRESFPASDPPSWTPLTGIGPRQRPEPVAETTQDT